MEVYRMKIIKIIIIIAKEISEMFELYYRDDYNVSDYRTYKYLK